MTCSSEERRRRPPPAERLQVGRVDHLLFLLALMLLVSGFVKLLKTITAFTVAHSVTLALATLGVVNVPPGPTEAARG